MRVAVGGQRRAVDAADASPNDQERLLGECDDVEAHRERRKQLELELEQMAAEFDDESDGKFGGSQRNADPVSFLCCCNFKRLGQSYILHERRVIHNGESATKIVIVGPHWIGVLVTLAIILASTGAFLDQQCRSLPWYYTVITLGFCLSTIYYLYQTACTDPGIVLPKREQAPKLTDDEALEHLEQGKVIDNEIEKDSDTIPLTATGLSSMRIHPPVRTRYCDICGIEQDRDTEHCEDCDVCITGYDHHCPWMGKCIGKKNMRAFQLFNVMWVMYVVFVLFAAIQNADWSPAVVQQLHRTASGKWALAPHSSHPTRL